MSLLISIDPGNSKCGILLADIKNRVVIEAGIVPINSFFELLSLFNKKYVIDKVIIGNGTNSNYLVKELKKEKINNLFFVNEKGSTFRARFRYWEIWPPKYLLSFFPKGLLFPPENLDAVVALILLEDFLNQKLTWPENVNLKVWP